MGRHRRLLNSGKEIEVADMPSEAIRFYKYDEAKRELLVGFRGGGDYVYLEVPREEHEALRAAPSKGAYINQVIKAKYRFRRRDRPARRGG
jgi:hypothetical protein